VINLHSRWNPYRRPTSKRRSKVIFIALFAPLIEIAPARLGCGARKTQTPTTPEIDSREMLEDRNAKNDLKITVIYDNRVFAAGLKPS